LIRLKGRFGATGRFGQMLQQFDPRQAGKRYAPYLLGGAAAVSVIAFGWQANTDFHADRKAKPPIAAVAEAPPAPRDVLIEVSRGETFEGAVRRAGVAADEAREVANTLAKAVTFNIFDDLKAGQKLRIAVQAPRDQRGPVRLIGLSMQTDPATTLKLSRSFDGALRLDEVQEKVKDETKVACGAIDGSLDESARKAGALPAQIHQVVELFAHKLDFARDIQPGDHFCLVFDRKVTESGATVEGGDLRYAEIEAGHLKGEGPVRFYRHLEAGSDKPQYFDELGKNIRGFLLRTPVDGAHITSSYGMRMHPLLGYTRMHQGIDFGVPTGTPVYAAGDGVVEEVRWAGGYGNWVKIRHSAGWETGYGHLSRWAKGLKPGQHVSQGQVIAYVGSTGESTGPHLHYEVMQKGAKITPKGAKVPSGSELAGKQLAVFKGEKAAVDTLLANAGAVQLAVAPMPGTVQGLTKASQK
jgi:murein DD-endopeptidase MepM/ murein hydrolase activator NlpD